MSLQDWTNLAGMLAILLAGFNILMLERVVRRLRDQVARLTRRVWVLEGSPRCECQAGEVEA